MTSAKDELDHFVSCLSEVEAEICLEACRRALGDNSGEERDEGPQTEGQPT
jgi:hypothetical protein